MYDYDLGTATESSVSPKSQDSPKPSNTATSDETTVITPFEMDAETGITGFAQVP